MIDDLYMHVNEEKDPELGILDLNKLKKRLFDPELTMMDQRFVLRIQELIDNFN